MVTSLIVVDTFKSVFDEITNGTDFKVQHLSNHGNANLSHEDLNTSIDKPENGWNTHIVVYNSLTSRTKPSNKSQL